MIESRWKVVSVRLLKFVLLILSILSGALFAIVWRNYELAVVRLSNLHSPMGPSVKVRQVLQPMPPGLSYQEWLEEQGLRSETIPREDLSYGNGTMLESEAKWLANHTRVLCMVLTTSRNRARALNNTWTRHCNDVIFYGRYHEKKLPYVKLKVLDENLFSPRTFCLAFVDLIDRKSDYDWLLITTDHTYAIVENLRHYVAPYTELSSSSPLYLGRPVHHYFLGTFNAYDSGIVLSLAAINLLANTVFLNRTTCAHLQDGQSLVLSGSFDAYIGAQLSKHGVKAINTLDGQESRFHPFMPEKHIRPQTISVFDSYWTSNVLPVSGGLHCCRYFHFHCLTTTISLSTPTRVNELMNDKRHKQTRLVMV